MKKKIFVVICVVLLTFLLFSCNEDNSVPSGMKRASDTSIVDYSLFVPESWIIDVQSWNTDNEGDRNTTVSMAHVSNTDKTSVNVMQWNISSDIYTLDSWWTDYKDQVGSAFVDFTVLTEGEETIVGGESSLKCTYTAKVGSEEYRFSVIAIKHKGSVYVITYTSKGDLYESNMEDFNTIVENFRFE